MYAAAQEPGGARLLAKDEPTARWGQAITRAKADVRVALLVDRPRLRIITGVGSVAVDDIRAQLREAEEEVELRVVRVSMHRPEEVARAVRQAGDAHLVAVTRGGGQDVHELEADELIGAVASSPVPVVAALGHAPDDLVLGRVADAAFPTPTAFGAWLRACVDEKRARARRLKEAEVLERTDGLLRQLEALQAAAGRLAWWRTAALVLAGLLLAVLLWVLLGR